MTKPAKAKAVKAWKAWATMCNGKVYDIWFTKRDAEWKRVCEGFPDPVIRVEIRPVERRVKK